MKHLFAAAMLSIAVPAAAALPVGTVAPAFTTQATLGGKPFRFDMRQALKKGPVVLYFYPAAFTKGCTVEAHNFAEATDDFTKLGATVIGMSNDDIATLNRFSVEACRSKFAVASADGALIAKYDAKLLPVGGRSNRTSYVVTPDGKIIYAYSAMDPSGHVTNTMEAVRKWRAANPVKTAAR